MVYIETPRLILRDWKEEDFVPFAEMNGNPSVMEFFLHPLSGEESRNLFDTVRNEFLQYATELVRRPSATNTDMADMPSSRSPMEPLWGLRAFITLCLMWTLLRVLRYCGD